MKLIIHDLLQASLSQQSFGVVGFAYLGGLISSLLPCTISMLPLLVGYIGGHSEDTTNWEIVIQVAMFVLGMALIMTVLGVVASLLGFTFGSLIGAWFYYLLGAIVIIFGLNLLEVIHIPLPHIASKLPQSKTGKLLTPFFLGITFGLTASPCGTPFLAAILSFIALEHNIALGAASLFAYTLGQCTLLLVVGLFTGLLTHLNTARKFSVVLHKASGVVFILAGLILLAQPSGLFASVMAALHII